MKNEKNKLRIFARETREVREKDFKIFFRMFRVFRGLIPFCVLLFFASCAQQMGSQPSVKPLEASPVFPFSQSARQPVFGTIPSGFTRTNQRIEAVENFDKNAADLPFPLTEEVLTRGRQRFEINCAICHGRAGDGDGMVARRGFSHPPTFHDDRLRNAPLGHFYDVITNGFGGMGSYANQVEARDRWAIAAYIRALQLSQNAKIEDVPPEKREESGKW